MVLPSKVSNVPKYRALITDLDGTAVSLSSNGSDIKDFTRQAVKKAEDSGFKITCATGRSWYLVKPLLEKLGFDLPCIVEGGTRIMDPKTDKALWEKHINQPAVAKILEIFKSETSEGRLLTHAEELDKPLREVGTAPKTARVMYLLDIPAIPAIAICNKINELGIAAANPTISWAGEGKLDVHVTHEEATKEHAIHVWQEMQGVTKEQTIGMGDSSNDIPLFQGAGLKVAVGNATPDLIELADYIAPPQSEDALAHVIRKYFLETSF